MNRSKKNQVEQSTEDLKDRADWDATAEGILIEGLKKAFNQGQKSDINYKATVYQEISVSLQAADYNLSQKQVKFRWTHYLDENTKCVTADEKVWKAALFNEADEKAKKYNEYNYWCTHSFPLYDEVTKLIGGSLATGGFAFASVSSDILQFTDIIDKEEGRDDENEDKGDMDENDPELPEVITNGAVNEFHMPTPPKSYYIDGT
ncbi:hypothetical protein F5880DRAFT_1511792 [Lentinula raphanica]|nr:hypothetical protein F5880DRAFT_1511792 [Lentinula raphanica]